MAMMLLLHSTMQRQKMKRELPGSMNDFYFHYWVNFPCGRALRLMKSVSAEPLNRRTYLCVAVVFVVDEGDESNGGQRK